MDKTRVKLVRPVRRTRKLLTMNGGLYPRDFVVGLYIPRKHGGRRLISVEDCIIQARLSLERSSRCLHKHVFASHDNENNFELFTFW